QLRVVRRRVDLEMEMRPGRVARMADEADGLTGGQDRTLDDCRIQVRKVAVRPLLAIARPQREADAAGRVRLRPGPDHDAVGERVQGRALRGRDVRGRVIVVVMRDRDDRGTTPDGEDVRGVVRHRRCEQRARPGGGRCALRLRTCLRQRVGGFAELRTELCDSNFGHVLADRDERRRALERATAPRGTRVRPTFATSAWIHASTSRGSWKAEPAPCQSATSCWKETACGGRAGDERGGGTRAWPGWSSTAALGKLAATDGTAR